MSNYWCRWFVWMWLVVTVIAGVTLRAQTPPADLVVDASARNAVIDAALTYLENEYVFPEVASRMVRAIQERRQRREYDAITSARALAEVLTAHLREVSRDAHLRIVYTANPNEVPPAAPLAPADLARVREANRAFLARTNFGFEKIEMIRANVGYLDLRAFFEPELMGDTAAAAMSFLANADALLIDIRSNGGGNPDGVALLASYLFSSTPVHLNDLYDRRSNQTRQFWTVPYLPGRRFAGKPVYLLTSARTFSAAEGFAHSLQALRRVTIVGETTRGGAHPMTSRRIDDHFFINVPWGRSINPITKTNWEQTGVQPDVPVPADRALTEALLLALEERAAAENDPMARAFLQNAIERTRRERDSR